MKRAHKQRRGFTLLEVLTVTAVIAILSGATIFMVAKSRETARQTKLESDVRRLNAAVGVYEAMGGSLAGVDTAAGVIRKLRMEADALSAEQLPGMAGSMVDRHLGVEMQMAAEAAGSAPRAVWDAGAKSFHVATSGAPGVMKFTRDADEAARDGGVEARAVSMKLATQDNWIWDFSDTGVPAKPASTLIAMGDVPTIPTGTPPGSGPLPNPGPGPGTTALDPPLFSVPSGDFPISDFDLAVALSNPNPANSSSIMFTLDGDNWFVYGGPLSVRPGVEVQAYAHSAAPEYTDSSEATEAYSALPVSLAVPVIAASASAFDFEENRVVQVSISDPNPQGASLNQYRVNNGMWRFYQDAFNLGANQYLSAATVEARAFPVSEYYLMSEVASVRVDERAPAELLAPNIYPSAPKFDYDANRIVTVSIANRNSVAASRVEYRIGGGGWTDYRGAFDLHVRDFEASPAIIEARAVSAVPQYLDGPVAAAAVVEPDPLFEISGDTTGRFENAEGGAEMIYDIVSDEEANTTFFSWGVSANANPSSSLLFAGDTFFDVSPGEAFLIGTLDYYNGTIYSRTEADAVELIMDMTFYDATADTTFDFAIELLNTVNSSDAWASADYVKLQDVASELTQTINGRENFLKLEFGETTANGFSTIDEFHVLENASATGSLFGTLWLADLDD